MKKVCFIVVLVFIFVFGVSACVVVQSPDDNNSKASSSIKEAANNSSEITDISNNSTESSIVTEENVSTTEEIEEKSLISVVSVYYGDIYSNQAGSCYSDQGLNGFTDCIIVFDYTNDATNRTLPKSKIDPGYLWTSGFTCSDVNLFVNNANTYEAYDPNGYAGHYSNALNRYTTYSTPIDYGNLLGGADTVRMYAVFYVNPNELKTDSHAVLNVDDQSVEFDFSGIRKITYPDEILSSEEKYEELQQMAAFKWRMDKLMELAKDVDHYMASMNPGSDLGGVGKSISSLFSSNYGVTVSGKLSAGFNKDYTYDGMNTDLPLFKVDTLTAAYPNLADDITGIVEATNKLGTGVQDPSYSKNDINEILKEIMGYYTNLTKAFGMDVYKPGK